MRRETAGPAPRSWLIMLADIIALMLAFFVLSFSMRELIVVEPALIDAERALGVLEGYPDAEHQALERQRASAPSFAYLAALIEAEAGFLSAKAVSHAANRLTVDLAGWRHHEARPSDPEMRTLFLTMAFLARRFALDLSLAYGGGDDVGLEARLADSLALRSWLTETAGLAAPEVIFPAATATDVPGDMPGGSAALAVRAAALPDARAGGPKAGGPKAGGP